MRAQTVGPPELLTPATGVYDTSSPNDPTVIRSRAVSLDLALLGSVEPGDTLTFNLFDDSIFVCVFEQRITRRADSYTWFGSLVGVPGSRFVLTVEKNVALANFQIPGGRTYRVRWLTDGLHVIQELDTKMFPPCETESQGIAAPQSQGTSSASSGGGCVDDGSTIDMLVVYTPAARDEQGGTIPMIALINQAEDLTNQVFADSLISTRINVVMMFEVNYVEAGPPGQGNSRKDLDCLMYATCAKCDSDGVGSCSGSDFTNWEAMQQVHAVRDGFRADVVSMITGDVLYGGRAGSENGKFAIHGEEVAGRWVVNAFPDLAFNVVSNQAVTFLTFTHELGHNLGCRHDRAQDNTDGAYRYSHGFKNQGIDQLGGPFAYRTIMGVTGFPGISTPKIGHFSNPNVYWQDCPTGNPFDCPTGIPVGQPGEADNALSINNVDTLAANFRPPGTDCNNNGVCDADDAATGTSLDCNANGVPDECDIADGTSADCNANSVPDGCDIAAGTSNDCDSNGVPDECDPDCNENGIPDDCEFRIPKGACCLFNPDRCEVRSECSCGADGGIYVGDGSLCSTPLQCQQFGPQPGP